MKKGENQLINITLYQQDGSTALNVSSLVSCVATLKQLGATVATYTLGTDGQIRTGDSANVLQIEITKSVSALLELSTLNIEVFLEVDDANFDVDSVQRDKKCILVNVVNC